MKSKNSSIKSPAFQFYPDDYLSDVNVELMTLEEQGAYMRLLCHAWKSDPVGTLPNEDKILGQLSRLGKEKWEKSKIKILRAFDRSNPEFLIQKRLVREYEKQKKNRKQKVRAGKASAAKRQRKINSRSTGVEIPFEQNSTLHLHSSTAVSLETKNKKEPEEKKPVPDLIEITPEMENWVKRKGIHDVLSETEKFLDYHRAKGTFFSDWAAAWRSWMRKSIEFSSKKQIRTVAASSSLKNNFSPQLEKSENPPIPGKYDHLYE